MTLARTSRPIRLLTAGAGVLLSGMALTPPAHAAPAPSAHATRTQLAAPGDLRTVRLPWFWPNNYLYDVSAAAADSVWISGTQGELIVPGPIPGTGTTVPGNPVVRRWNGTAWQEYPLRGWSGNGSISSVAAVAPDDVWVSGPRYANGTYSGVYLARFTGTGFDPVAPPEGVRGAGLRATPGGLLLIAEVGGDARVFRRSGDSWSAYPPPGLRTHTVHARTPDDIWIFGDTSAAPGKPIAKHWNGTEWRSTPLPPIRGEYASITGAYALSADDVWAAGIDRTRTDPPGTPMLLHWDGTAWSPATVPTSGINELGEIGRDGTGALWVSGHATDTPNRPVLLRYDGQQWERLQTPAVSGQSNVHMLQLAAVPTSDKVWILGSGSIGGPIVMTNG